MTQNFNSKFTYHNRIKSFKCSVKGLAQFYTTQHNAWIELAIAVFVIVLGVELQITPLEWFELTIAIALVFVAEILNTAIEYLTDLVSPQYNELAGKVKDIAAAAVLVATIFSIIIAIIIFKNYLI